MSIERVISVINLQPKLKMRNLLKFSFLLLLVSCVSPKIIELGGKASTKGQEVSQNGIDILKVLSQQAAIDKSQQDKITVLTDPDPARMPLPDTKVKNDFPKALDERMSAYQSLLNTYKAFSLLTDSKYSDKTQEATIASQDSYNAISILPDIPATVSALLPKVAKTISQHIQARKIKKHNEILFALSEVYAKLWEEDKKTWNAYIDRVYDDYITGLNGVKSSRYDAKKISENDKEPFSDTPTVILMYRLNKRDELNKEKNKLKKSLNDFGKVLNELNKAHAEISKSKTEILDAIKTMNTIENLLKEMENARTA